MAAGLTGRRVPFRPGFPGGPHGPRAEPGDYCKVPAGLDPRGDGAWYVVDPTGGAGALISHEVVEHEDGTITASPSIVMPGGWHGYLRRGEWSTV